MTAQYDLFGKLIQGSDRVALLIDKIFRLTVVTLKWKINVNINRKFGKNMPVKLSGVFM